MNINPIFYGKISKKYFFWLTFSCFWIIIARTQKFHGGIAQLVEHSLDVRRVRGSSPFASTTGESNQGFALFLLIG